MRPHCTLVGALACTVTIAALVGCTPGGQPPDGQDPTVPGQSAEAITTESPDEPLTEADLPDLLRDFDERLNSALQQALLPPYPTDALTAYATGPELAVGEFNVALADAGGELRAPVEVRHAGEQLYTGRFVSDPTWVMVGASATSASPGQGTTYAGISVFTRSDQDSPWLLTAFAPMSAGRMPATFSGADATPAASDVVRANELGTQLDAYWETGEAPADVALDPTLRAVREGLVTPGSDDVAGAEVSVERYPRMPTYAVRVDGATMAMLSFRAEVTYRARPGRTLRWSGPRALLYGRSPQAALTTDYVFNALVAVPEEGGQARVLSLGLPEILAPGRPLV